MADYLIHAPDGTPASSFGGTLGGSDTLTWRSSPCSAPRTAPCGDVRPRAGAGRVRRRRADRQRRTIQAGSTAVASTGTSTALRSLDVVNETTGTIVASGPGATLALGRRGRHRDEPRHAAGLGRRHRGQPRRRQRRARPLHRLHDAGAARRGRRQRQPSTFRSARRRAPASWRMSRTSRRSTSTAAPGPSPTARATPAASRWATSPA